MSVSIWILLSFAIIFTTLYIVGFIKNINILRDLSSSLILPLIGTTNIFLLLNYLPDSSHILIITFFAYITAIASQILFIFENKRKLVVLANFLYLISTLIWGNLYVSSFYIYRVSSLLIIMYAIFFVIVSCFTCILSGKQKIYYYAHSIAGIFCTCILSLFSFIFLFYGKKLSAILLFAGATVNIALVIFYILDNSRFNFKFRKPLYMLLIVASQTLISYSNLLMLQ